MHVSCCGSATSPNVALQPTCGARVRRGGELRWRRMRLNFGVRRRRTNRLPERTVRSVEDLLSLPPTHLVGAFRRNVNRPDDAVGRHVVERNSLTRSRELHRLARRAAMRSSISCRRRSADLRARDLHGRYTIGPA
jgi:hypothetical protein